MKKALLLQLCSALVLFGLATNSTAAGFVSPTLRSPQTDLLAQDPLPPGDPPPPPGPPVVWIVVNTHDSGPGSLRHAISQAAAGDRIRFALPSPAIIILRSTLVIDKDLEILGPGPDDLIVARALFRAPNFRVFRVNSGVVTIAGLAIFNGRANNTDTAFHDNVGGGILNFGSLTVSNCVAVRNVAPTTATNEHGFGGGVFSQGPLRIINSTFRDNSATYAGGGVCTFHSSRFIAEGCTINDNFAGVQGGGVNFQGNVNGTASGKIKNCTISGNSTRVDGYGSGLEHIVFAAEASDLALTACTITRNHGSTNGGINIVSLSGNLGIATRMIGTLVADNPTRNFFLEGNPPLTSLGHNLDSDGTSGLVNGVHGDIVGTVAHPINARLGSLQENGGPTRTHALLIGSPALDAGALVDADGAPLLRDQRGFPRLQGLANDIGAFENQAPTVICPRSGIYDCDEDLTATVNDRDGDALTVVWVVNGRSIETNFLAAVHPAHPRVVKLQAALSGVNTVTVRAFDGKAPVVECTTVIVVRANDTPPRIIEIKANPSVLWPPDHRLVPVRVTVRAEDCGPIACRIVSVESNEPVGHDRDWIVTGDLTLLLRAERSGHRHDRIYTITVRCRDVDGHTSHGTVRVTVPRERDHDDDDHDHHGDD